jgi:metabolite-proton symporter
MQSESGSSGEIGNVRIGRVAIASFVGTAVEFYDFYIYGIAVALVINTEFFPNLSSTAGTLAAFSTFAVAFIARPLGSLLFGHFGDRLGRKSTLVASLLTMGLSTVAIGLLPGYATIGAAAPTGLVLLRFVQGLGLGGEWGGAALLAAEYAPKGKRGWYGIFPQLGPPIGFFTAGGVFLVLSSVLDEAAFRSWGWRVPFLISVVLVAVGLVVRLRIAETPVFAAIQRSREYSRAPLVDMLRQAPLRILLSAGAIIVGYVLFYVTTTFSLSYATHTLELSSTVMLFLQIMAIWVMALTIVVSCRMSDRLGRRSVLAAGCAGVAVVGPVFFPLLDTKSFPLIGLALVLALGVSGWVYGPLAAFLPELFDARHRYSASSFSYNLGGVLGGGLAPTVASWLVAHHGAGSVGYYLAGAAVISFLCTLALPETRHVDLAAGLRLSEVEEVAAQGTDEPFRV